MLVNANKKKKEILSSFTNVIPNLYDFFFLHIKENILKNIFKCFSPIHWKSVRSENNTGLHWFSIKIIEIFFKMFSFQSLEHPEGE